MAAFVTGLVGVGCVSKEDSLGSMLSGVDGREGSLGGSVGLTMRCRRNLKDEKRARNQLYARLHRKKIVRYNRRAAETEKTDTDNEYLSMVYNTIHFGGAAPGGSRGHRDEDGKKGGPAGGDAGKEGGKESSE
mmetsp:Transcript_8948/g.18011  ORF Transcript_8948/g.18011 Transcript_8948/m.18011 type:complete len:133 (-) Transcript_8948:1410-1808(-)|eukprot:CAMPEP_0184679054 /NCGR_PEP_ID=MMETSP0312-20130426/1879_1 /TAXON_ID=31354 /ORGANISM="Compsopogon coeruleus, Strain SAG 36.94" /LENGTH=132 /DNA_ID=CAMNT_0027128253 /DNA_START=103 /DNA_END=501 /DNA_ORIENTATION=-